MEPGVTVTLCFRAGQTPAQGQHRVHLYPSFPCQQHCSGLLVPQSGGDLPRVGSGVCARHDDLALIGKTRTLGGVRDGQRASVHANFGLVPLLLPDQTSPHSIHKRAACTSPASLGDASSPLPHLS